MTGTDTLYCVHRVIQWGDCDPAGIIYTPRAIDFAIEALEAWYRDVLEASWASLPRTFGMGSPVVRVECDYLARLPADQPVALAVYVERIGGASITYRIVCGDDAEREFFRARVVTCCLAIPERTPKPIPETLRERIETYAAAWGNGGTANKGR